MRRDESFLSLPFNHLSCLMTPRERCVHPSQASSFLNMHTLNTELELGRHQEDPKDRQASKPHSRLEIWTVLWSQLQDPGSPHCPSKDRLNPLLSPVQPLARELSLCPAALTHLPVRALPLRVRADVLEYICREPISTSCPLGLHFFLCPMGQVTCLLLGIWPSTSSTETKARGSAQQR